MTPSIPHMSFYPSQSTLSLSLSLCSTPYSILLSIFDLFTLSLLSLSIATLVPSSFLSSLYNSVHQFSLFFHFCYNFTDLQSSILPSMIFPFFFDAMSMSSTLSIDHQTVHGSKAVRSALCLFFLDLQNKAMACLPKRGLSLNAVVLLNSQPMMSLALSKCL